MLQLDSLVKLHYQCLFATSTVCTCNGANKIRVSEWETLKCQKYKYERCFVEWPEIKGRIVIEQFWSFVYNSMVSCGPSYDFDTYNNTILVIRSQNAKRIKT